jgi:hypothetical protein
MSKCCSKNRVLYIFKIGAMIVYKSRQFSIILSDILGRFRGDLGYQQDFCVQYNIIYQPSTLASNLNPLVH